MNKIITIIAALALSMPALKAQDTVYIEKKQERHPGQVQTIFKENAGHGGYGAISVGYGIIDDRDAILVGGRGEWVIGHGFGLGFGGYGFMNDPRDFINEFGSQYKHSLAGGYGGLIIEPILMGWFPVHLAFPILIGGGGVASTSFQDYDYYYYDDFDSYVEDATAFFVAEAGIELEFNLVSFFRLSFFGNYRYTTDIILENVNYPGTISTDALKGWTVGMNLKFGSF